MKRPKFGCTARAWLHVLRLPASSLVAAAVVFVCVLVGCATVLTLHMRDDIVHDTTRDLRGLTALLAEQADRSLQAMEIVEAKLAEEARTRRLLDGSENRAIESDLRRELVVSIAALPQVAELAIVDIDGRSLDSSMETRPVAAEVLPEHVVRRLRGAADGRVVLVNSPSLRPNASLDLIVAHRIESVTGRPLGFVVGFVDLGYFERLYADVSPAQADVISFVHEDGTMLARQPRPPGAIGRKVPLMGWMRKDPAERVASGTEEMVTPIDGERRVVAARYLAHYPIVIGSSRTKRAMLSGWRDQAWALGTAVFLLAVGVVVLVRIAARQMDDQRRLAAFETARLAEEERNRRVLLIQEEHARFGMALDNMSQGLLLVDADRKIIVCNARLASMFDVPLSLRQLGHDVDALLGHVQASVSGPQATSILDMLAKGALRDGCAECALEDGRTVEVRTASVTGGAVVFTFEDATESHQAERVIAHMAHHDALTGLPNRLPLRDAKRRLLASEVGRRNGAVLLMDLDGFKGVNDRYGHPFGDALLREVTARLKREVGPTDLLARLGGDEFAIVRFGEGEAHGENVQPSDATALAARIVQAIQAPFIIDGARVLIGTSIGIRAGITEEDRPEVLLRDADVALYRAKAAGRGTWCLYDPHMEREIQARRELEDDISHALSAQELELHYQPVVAAGSMAVVAYEALLRWNHPRRGSVSPSEFIPMCEQNGLIRQIGAWVLMRACSDAATWPEHTKVAVNLSPVQFVENELIAAVDRALSSSGLSPSRLEIEITESVLLRDDDANLAILKALHAKGACIAMDDFGTGYSSLSYLRKFPFDKVKIDRSFLTQLHGSGENLAVMRAAIGLGKALGMTVLAEGVETEEERLFLAAEGCDELQGYLFGRPLPMHALGISRRGDAQAA